MARAKTLDRREFPGRGILSCNICGRPYIEHDIAPCPLLEAAIISGAPVSGVAGRQNSGKCRMCGEQAQLTANRKGHFNRYCGAECRKKWSKKSGG